MESKIPFSQVRKGSEKELGGQRGHEGARRFVKQEGAPGQRFCTRSTRMPTSNKREGSEGREGSPATYEA